MASAANKREGGLRTCVAEELWHRKNGSEHSPARHLQQTRARLSYVIWASVPSKGVCGMITDPERSQHLPRPWYQVLAHQALCQHLAHSQQSTGSI